MKNEPNIGFLFYKDYYDSSFWTKIFLKGEKIKNQEGKKNYKQEVKRYFDNKNNNILKQNKLYPLQPLGKDHFTLKTIYPGLLFGAGYMHETGQDNEFKIGFYFDYTTGMPYIPGSSVKGLLRSAFKASESYIREIFKSNSLFCNVNEISISDLENEIFEGKKSIYDRDIFFDAVLIKSDNTDGRFLGEDFITPHKDPLKNPVPIKFLKVLPNVVFRFEFDLKDGILSVEQKLALFKQIILDLGIGAKTNVGYGNFEPN
ncbi:MULTISPECIES: type III-B CRISPR module RAMP protein Cmr6 [Defluviitalea]|uniref:Type III-B CRISPR module RAMP protein Cmr6 n=2 Tax=Defluviitalea TaxID=1185408 RepID=A0A7C8HG67_9FIRM|nr:type III-B CRISPR module RAMP protein Cmr6 [Defluviitalea raffinosedens]KAE9633435.1 type III-B CRISPR module RAMP protein Cmr6 [Defluviitalea raffinosedens]MBM7687170.1 CRISPR-associated protein Cmr6 [Defluviitalea raffinosedens]